jgi:aminoglycoside 6-adenylyltransferase
MRSEREMLDVILDVARGDERIRAVIMNGSRANPNSRPDPFQDFDIIYLVTDVAPFRRNLDWITRFGELMILQTPDDMGDARSRDRAGYQYLMQFTDGNRIDLMVYSIAEVAALRSDSLSIPILDKDGALEGFPPPSERGYLPVEPTAKEFADCCNEFWWVSVYVAKGLWREHLTYARCMLDQALRDELMKMLTWFIGLKTDFACNLGAFGKYFEEYLEPELWQLLRKTYAEGDSDSTWHALFAMCDLFRRAAIPLADHYGFRYPHEDDRRVSAHLVHVRQLPKDAAAIY